MAHEYLLYVTFFASKIVLRHPKRDASKNVSIPIVSKFYEILHVSYISRDDSNGEICFVIQDPEKFRILTEITICNRNYDFALFPEIGISRVLQIKISFSFCNDGNIFITKIFIKIYILIYFQ